ncbi:MAG: phosphoribosylanthranilate isomerase [Actinobacteria bacterium]|nr:phosphoribosylanthranilate isomerase [Actinomycetota bacterium]
MIDLGERFVKICGVTTEADALLAVGFGASAVGFILAPSPRQVSLSEVRDIVHRLPPEVITVGVFRDEAPASVVEQVNEAGLGAAQLHGHESPEAVRYVRERVPLVIKALPAGSQDVSRFEEFGADYLLLDSPSPGSGATFDWALALGVADPRRLIIGGGLDPSNVAEMIDRLHPFGVDVATGVERSPGVKDPRLVSDFIFAARSVPMARHYEEEGEQPFDQDRH